DGVLEFGDLAVHINRDLLGKIAAGYRGGDLRDVAHLTCEVAGHGVDVVRQVFPGAGRSLHVRLAAEPALGTHLARHAGDFAGEAVELIDHRVDGVFQPEDLAANVNCDLLRQVAPGDGGRDVGDVANLGRQVAGHRVDVVGEVLPDPGGALDLGLAAKLPFRPNFPGNPGAVRVEGLELLDHRVDRSGRPQELTLQRPAVQLQIHGLEEVAFGDRGDDPGNAGEVLRVALVQLDNAVHLGGDPGHDAGRHHRHTYRDVAL